MYAGRYAWTNESSMCERNAPSNVGGAMVGGVLWSERELFDKLEAKYGAKVEVPNGATDLEDA